ncbi:MAG: hypothetical protein QOC81_2399 [Thermoanaerobaculia bacterium]|jgi:hypothetical protein|nr:hypothetical protein [Thermoanaerobaculia bacterium]
MNEVYRKWGSVVRYENGVTISVEEAGEATEVNGVFEARPMGAQTRVSVPHGSLLVPQTLQTASYVAQTLLSVHSCTIERLIISAGVSRHETNGVTWTEESQRVHLSLVKGQLRVLIDLASFDIDAVRSAASALALAGDAREAPHRIRLAPNVAAALLPSLVGEIAIEQYGGGFDGKGQAIETRAVTDDPPPNWYRPSYAIRPRRAWLNLRALPFGSIDKSAPVAVALLGPVTGTTLDVLCVDGNEVFPIALDAQRIAAVSREEPVWYPYAAGSFGAEMML